MMSDNMQDETKFTRYNAKRKTIPVAFNLENPEDKQLYDLLIDLGKSRWVKQKLKEELSKK